MAFCSLIAATYISSAIIYVIGSLHQDISVLHVFQLSLVTVMNVAMGYVYIFTEGSHFVEGVGHICIHFTFHTDLDDL